MRFDGFFVTGTDTGIGKTWVSRTLMEQGKAQGLKVLGMKPVAAGCELVDGQWVNEDALLLQQHGSIRLPYRQINPCALQLPASPHIAAAAQQQEIQLDELLDACHVLRAQCDRLIVEGAGGWAVPLASRVDIRDLAVAMQLPVIVVVGLRLGCLNHAMLTVEAIRSSGLACHGWVGNILDPAMPHLQDNIATLRARLQVPCMGIIPYMNQYDESVSMAALNAPVPG